MLTKEEKIRRIKGLKRTQVEVLYYFCQGLTDDEICVKLDNMAIKTLQGHRTDLYKALLEENIGEKEKQIYLAQEYSALIPEVIPSEDVLRRWRPTITIENEAKSEQSKKSSLRKFIVPLGIVVLVVILLVGVGYVSYMAGKGALQVPFISSPTSFEISASQTPQITDTLLSTPTLTIATNTLIPTDTLVPTNTFTPTPTNTIAPTEFIPPADGILFQADFESGDLSAWSQLTGKWLISDGKLTILADENIGINYQWISLNRPEWHNYILSIDLNKSYNNGVAVSVRDNSSTQPIGFEIGWGDDIQLVLISDNWTSNTQIAGNSDVDVAEKTDVNIQLEVQDDTYTLRLNGREIQKVTYAGYISGGIAFGVNCTDDRYGCTTFDNVKVTYLP